MRPQVFDRQLEQTISFREVKWEEDVERLHSWHQEEHVIPFWQQNMPLEQYKSHLKSLLADTHQTLWIGEIDGVPMSYWETYWCERDSIGSYYEVEKGDQGIHLLIGKQEYLGQGYALPMLRLLTEHVLNTNGTNRVIAEPDSRNDKMIHIFGKCGYESKGQLSLPDKEARLMICHQSVFQQRWERLLHDTNV